MIFWAGFLFGMVVSAIGAIIGAYIGSRQYSRTLDALKEMYDDQERVSKDPKHS